jgi:putative Holliday junction resolvase
MTTLLGLDVGDKRVGVALSDGTTVVSIGTFNRAQGEAESKIIQLVGERKVDIIVSGLPLSENGEKNSQCQKVENFCRRLMKRLHGVELAFVDEYLTSVEAEQQLKSTKSGRSRGDKATIDALSAVIILQDYVHGRKPG